MSENYTIEDDEIGIWLLVNNGWGEHRVACVTWHQITKRIQQQLLQEKFLMVLAKLDEDLL